MFSGRFKSLGVQGAKPPCRGSRVRGTMKAGVSPITLHRRQVKDGRKWPDPACRATARVAPTLHEQSFQPSRVGAGLAPALGAAWKVTIDSILRFLHLTPMGRSLRSPCKLMRGPPAVNRLCVARNAARGIRAEIGDQLCHLLRI